MSALRRYNPDLEETVLRAKAQKLYRDTGSITAVSKKLNLSRALVKKLIKEMLLPKVTPRHTGNWLSFKEARDSISPLWF